MNLEDILKDINEILETDDWSIAELNLICNLRDRIKEVIENDRKRNV